LTSRRLRHTEPGRLRKWEHKCHHIGGAQIEHLSLRDVNVVQQA
jgi:hypothetical protein